MLVGMSCMFTCFYVILSVSQSGDNHESMCVSVSARGCLVRACGCACVCKPEKVCSHQKEQEREAVSCVKQMLDITSKQSL